MPSGLPEMLWVWNSDYTVKYTVWTFSNIIHIFDLVIFDFDYFIAWYYTFPSINSGCCLISNDSSSLILSKISPIFYQNIYANCSWSTQSLTNKSRSTVFSWQMSCCFTRKYVNKGILNHISCGLLYRCMKCKIKLHYWILLLLFFSISNMAKNQSHMKGSSF